ncbi:MAG: succinylglutamate desuccinylase/aspartoacylase family protein [Phascolarctobacterium sp.]|nr:succinylglutamate desuccinylase/aspartoacylase family protein [Phascolarctobacterium sp.]
MKASITFGGITAAPGTKASGWAPVLDTDYKLPVTVINGAREGKSVLLTSAIHGCEYPSIEAVFRIAENIDPQELCGQLIVINPVNVDGFLKRTPYIVPQDGKNLNRLFPGNPAGTLGDKIAYVLTEEYQKRVDFHIDTHGGDIPEKQLSYVYYPGVSEDARALALSEEAAAYVLYADFVIKSRATNHAYNYAAICGVPSVELELGDCASWDESEVNLYLENIYNLLRYLRLLPGEARKRERDVLYITRGEYLDADADGRWYACVGREDKVRRGQKLGEIRDLFGRTLREYYAEFDGVVLMVVAALAVKKGDPIIAYGC